MPSKTSPKKRAASVRVNKLLFAAELGKGIPAKHAAMACGVPSHLASKRGHELKNDPEVKAALAKTSAKQAERVEISNDRLRYEVQRCVMASMENYTVVDGEGMPHFNLSNLTPDQWAAISEISTETVMESTGEYDDNGKPIKLPVRKMKFKLHDKLKASQLLAQIKGMITTKSEITNPDGSLRQPPALNIVLVAAPPPAKE